MLTNSPPVGNYEPSDELIQRKVIQDVIITQNTPRFDDYQFKKLVEGSPSSGKYLIIDNRDISYQDQHKY